MGPIRSIRRGVPVLLGILLFAGAAGAAEPREYSYLHLQGKIADPLDRRPLAGAEVLLRGEAGSFEAETDRNGVFVFERLPVADYDLVVTAADGRVLRGVTWLDPDEPERIRLRIDLGRGPSQTIRVEGRGGRIGVTIPEPRTRWKKLWIEFWIFAGTAGLLAL